MNLISEQFDLELRFSKKSLLRLRQWFEHNGAVIVGTVLSVVSVAAFIHYYLNGLGLAYNDARSHLDIGRRVVEGLKPGLAQLGSVWLPLTHLLMVPTIWFDFMWHSGLSGALQSMGAFVATGLLIYHYMKKLGVGLLGRFVGVGIFAANINVLYLQSTAMTELMLLATMTAAAYQLLRWFDEPKILHLITAAFWIMLSTMVRYDGWFLLGFATALVAWYVWTRQGYRIAEGTVVLFCTLGGFGIFLWLLWNLLIFKDPLYFIFGPYSAHAQQEQLAAAGGLPTKGSVLLSLKIYFYALVYNTGAWTLLLGAFGALRLWWDRSVPSALRLATVTLLAPLFFNVLALYLGHSVLYIQGISGDTWFNVRYGLMLVPSVAIFVGYLVDRLSSVRWVVIGSLVFVLFFAVTSGDAVTIDDALVGSSQKNVSEVSSWLARHTAEVPGFILISAASHDAIIFSSGLPMKKFIHEGTDAYWKSAVAAPDRWARWIVMRTYSDDDQTYKLLKDNPGFSRYELVDHYPFADIYQLRPEYLGTLQTEPVLGRQR